DGVELARGDLLEDGLVRPDGAVRVADSATRHAQVPLVCRHEPARRPLAVDDLEPRRSVRLPQKRRVAEIRDRIEEALGRIGGRFCHLFGSLYAPFLGALSVLGVIRRAERVLALAPREHEEDEHGADEYGDEPRGVRPLVAVEERRLRSREDRTRVLWMAGRDVLGARERELELSLGRTRYLTRHRLVRHRRGVVTRQDRPEDRGHESAAEVALEIRSTGGHADASDRDRPGEGVRRGGSGEADTDSDEDVRDRDLPVRGVLFPEQQHPDEREDEGDVTRE